MTCGPLFLFAIVFGSLLAKQGHGLPQPPSGAQDNLLVPVSRVVPSKFENLVPTMPSLETSQQTEAFLQSLKAAIEYQPRSAPDPSQVRQPGLIRIWPGSQTEADVTKRDEFAELLRDGTMAEGQKFQDFANRFFFAPENQEPRPLWHYKHAAKTYIMGFTKAKRLFRHSGEPIFKFVVWEWNPSHGQGRFELVRVFKTPAAFRIALKRTEKLVKLTAQTDWPTVRRSNYFALVPMPPPDIEEVIESAESLSHV